MRYRESKHLVLTVFLASFLGFALGRLLAGSNYLRLPLPHQSQVEVDEVPHHPRLHHTHS